MRLVIVLLATGSVALAACGGSSSGSSSSGSSSGSSSSGSSSSKAAATSGSAASAGGGGKPLKISADPGGQLKFNTRSLSAKSGTVTISMSNPSSITHGVGIKGQGVNKVGKVVGKGGTSTVSLKLKPGTYTFYCPVPGHAAAGMKGTLTVK